MVKREQIQMDIVFVGAGPANLAAALHLKNLIRKHNEEVEAGIKKSEKIEDVEIAIVEKGSSVGAHILSGAVMNPKALKELMPDFLEQGCPIDTEVKSDAFWYLTEKMKFESPITPPPLRNHGYYIVSLSRICEWLAEKCEQAGINIFPEFPATEILYDKNDAVIGVRIGEKGIGKDGKPKANYEPGVDLLAKVTVLGEGPRGSLAKQLISRLGLDKDREPAVYSLGIKELWEVPAGSFKEGHVVHTLGFPSDSQTYGGGWIYGMKNNIVSIGYVTGLDYLDPMIDPHAEFQKFKTHPAISRILQGGKLIKYGAKTINAGGWHTMPQLYADGVLLVGDTASFLNSQRLKGIHTAMKSGMLAAETILEALIKNDFSSNVLRHYERKVNNSWLYDELHPVRNFHGAFQRGRWSALINAGLQFLSGGFAWGFIDRESHQAGHERMLKLDQVKNGNKRYEDLKFDKKLTFDKLTNVYYGSVAHNEDQPPHLHILDPEICATRCVEEYGNPCERFCPAAVYEMEFNQKTGRKELKINFTNCVHCKTCDIIDPYQIINWVTPEGGGGPNYKGM
ncbi:MAG: electron transfer flavoprotein-ubiquinone oxidoreductase [Pyrinomonadaceae bacterium]|nr:electron transfer flavoprotein-ubiquinone oxidoreductase [Pyrinomonadaceae bacterium]MCX7639570.1 electron transfer flavoprotein-ubiquinone oxidoreductase [Pyrinomonadaceae bacterium]MDW8303963.1 electron transfer flavoprotein-ubiquinone oxidoreductase [Acidobacteriota bacterium]